MTVAERNARASEYYYTYIHPHVKKWGLYYEFWSFYKTFRRLGYGRIMALQAAAYEWDIV